MLTKKAKYALRALVYLSQHRGEGPVKISTLAHDEGMPRKFLEQILLELNNKGILQSRKGKGGGYSLKKKDEDIRIGEVLRLIDGPLAPVACVSKTAYAPCADCRDESSCGIRAVMSDVREAIADVLDHTNLADMIRKSNEVTTTWNYEI